MDAFRFMVFDGSYEDAKKMAEKILEDNVTRRFLSDKWTEHAINEIAFGDMEYEHPLTLYLPGIPEGIIGIVAGRLAEYFKTPCFLLGDTRNPEWIKGSGRSYGKVHLKELLDRNKKYLVKYGGHAFAASPPYSYTDNQSILLSAACPHRRARCPDGIWGSLH